MNDSKTSRRRFLVAAITFSGLAGSTAGAPFLGLSKAWAQSENSSDAQANAAMVRMARVLYPHDAIADDVYMDVLNLAMSATASDGSFAAILDTAAAALNANQSADFIDLDEAAQIAALRSIESQPYFAAIQMNVGATFYYHPAVWALLGYEGPSFDQGGYLHRGSGDIDWLPESK
jgi:hypothetical protein